MELWLLLLHKIIVAPAGRFHYVKDLSLCEIYGRFSYVETCGHLCYPKSCAFLGFRFLKLLPFQASTSGIAFSNPPPSTNFSSPR